MNKKISIIVVVLLVLFGIYLLSAKFPMNNSADENVAASDNATINGINIKRKGPVGVAKGYELDYEYLVDKFGFTLYATAADAKNNTTDIKTSCDAICEQMWGPYLLGDSDTAIEQSSDPVLSKLNIFNRADGKQQYALGNQPLYRYSGDTKVGDVKGPVESNWMVARP